MDTTQEMTGKEENLVVLPDNAADDHGPEAIMDENTIILASGDTYSLINMDALEEAIKDSGMSYQTISEKADISLSSVYKFLSRTSKSPSFYNVVRLMWAVGCSVDALCGLKPRPISARDKNLDTLLSTKDKIIEDLTAQRDRYRDHFTREINEVRRLSDERLKEKQKNIEELQTAIHEQNSTIDNQSKNIDSQSKIIGRQYWAIIVLSVILSTILVVDLLLGGVGFIRYDGGLYSLLFG